MEEKDDFVEIRYKKEFFEIRDGFKNKPVDDGEEMSDEDLVETSGYIPAKIQIENLIMAGRRLDVYREEMYDYPDGLSDDDNPILDPTRKGNYDLVDAQNDMENLKKRIKKNGEEMEIQKSRKKLQEKEQIKSEKELVPEE